MSLALAQPTEWWMEIPPHIQTQCWQESQTLATPERRQAVYLNQLCLQVFLPWFQQDYGADACPWPDLERLPSIWETVGGSGITVGTKRLVILPMDTLDTTGMDVPQEWVDIPGWVADYYFAIQVDLENCWLRVWGYTTHERLKQKADYDPIDRTYGVSAQLLERDLNAFWVTCQQCPEAATQVAVQRLPDLSEAEAHQTMEPLFGRSFPRLTLPFEQWGAILDNVSWRQRLYQNRLNPGLSEAPSGVTSTNLGQWLKDRFTEEWQSLEALLGAGHLALAHNLRRARHVKGFCAPRVKFITLNAEVEPQTVALLMALNTEADGRMGVRVQVHPATPEQPVPPALVLAIYSQDDEILQSIQANGQEDYMRLPHFRCPAGTQFRLQITLDEETFSETFSV